MASELWHQQMDAAVRIAGIILQDDSVGLSPTRTQIRTLCKAVLEVSAAYPGGRRLSDPS